MRYILDLRDMMVPSIQTPAAPFLSFAPLFLVLTGRNVVDLRNEIDRRLRNTSRA